MDPQELTARVFCALVEAHTKAGSVVDYDVATELARKADDIAHALYDHWQSQRKRTPLGVDGLDLADGLEPTKKKK
jgi:hypothetical protein